MSLRFPMRELRCVASCPLLLFDSILALQSRNTLMVFAELSDLESQARADLAAATDEASIRGWNTKYFGDSGLMKAALGKLGTLPKDQRAAYGQAANQLKTALATAYEQALAAAKEAALQASLTAAPLDVTLPGRPVRRGRLHPATQI